MSSKSILVPIDFTEVAECALGHAIKTAKKIDADVHLLHLVDEKDNIDEFKEKLGQVASSANANNPDIKFHQVVRVGNIFDDIGDTASEIGAGLIIMGTHGKRGLQYCGELNGVTGRPSVYSLTVQSHDYSGRFTLFVKVPTLKRYNTDTPFIHHFDISSLFGRL